MKRLSEYDLNLIEIDTPVYCEYTKEILYIASNLRSEIYYSTICLFHLKRSKDHDNCRVKYCKCNCKAFLLEKYVHRFILIENDAELIQIEMGMSI